MSYGDSRYAKAPLAGGATEDFEPPNEVIPPPVPGGTGVYHWGAENGRYPWAWGGYGGIRPLIPFLPGGIVVVPQHEEGTVKLIAWWPSASFLQFLRVTDDGVRTPVRGGYGAPVLTANRLNSVTNPSLEEGLNGYVPGTGSPTLTRIEAPTDVAEVPDGRYALRATIASAGTNQVNVPLGTFTAAATVTVSVGLAFVERPTSLEFIVTWTDSGGGALANTTVTFTADQINTVVGQWNRLSGTVTPPPGAVTPGLKVTAGGLPAGATMDLDAAVFESGASDGSYFDGDTLGAVWLGTADLSASQLAPMVTVVDPDCPLDVPVHYIVSDPGITGGYAFSPAVTLESQGRFCWLTHPRRLQPVKCDLARVPTLEREIEQGVYWPIGRKRAVVVSTQRRSATGELVFNADSFDERDLLLTLMADGSPMLLRAPARYGYGYGTWWSFGAVSEDRGDRLAFHDAMTLTARSTEVDAPTPFILEDVL